MSLSAFQRRRRELAQQEVVEVEQPSNEEQPKELTPEVVDSLSVDEVKERLAALNVKFAPNTGEAKLKEKLKDAISGS